MNKFLLILSFLLYSFSGFSQSDMEKIFGLKPVESYPDVVYLRIERSGNFINIWKDSTNQICGEIKFGAIWSYKKKEETILKTYTIDQKQCKEISELYDNYGIDSLRDDSEIYPNIQFIDGNPITIERKNYDQISKKDYNTVLITDSIFERSQVARFIFSVDSILKLDSVKKDFELLYPLLGSISDFSGESTVSTKGGSEIGYRYSLYAPLGFYISKYFYATKKHYIHSYLYAYYNTNLNNNFDFGFDIGKAIRLKNEKLKFCNIQFRFRERNLKEVYNPIITSSVQFSLKYFLAGVQIKKSDNTDPGFLFGFSYRIPKVKLNTYFRGVVYSNEFEFALGITKDFNKKVLKNFFSVGIEYENLQEIRLLNAKLGINIL